MNQIVNMVSRIVMRKVLSKGIDAGLNKASSLRGAQKKQAKPQQNDVDAFLGDSGSKGTSSGSDRG